jgi:UDP-4-amino-4,6-dideoxy-N-acetyl-beta-L-altrosamine transaminase
MIPYGRQDINQDDIDAVVDVLRSDFLTQGPTVPEFELDVSVYCCASHAVAANSATSALHLACIALGLEPGDWLWTSPITFVASANCGLYCGAQVDFVDIDPRTYNMSADRLAEKLAHAEKIGKLPKIVVPVHLCGQSCEMDRIFSLSQHYGFKIIEDASHAVGGKYKDEPIGNCKFSDITIFSFHPVKIITTGEGGMALTNDDVLADSMRRHRSHGNTNDASKMIPMPDDEIWNYQQISLGYNYRLTDIQAALGLSQMKRLNEYITKRHLIAKSYNVDLIDLPLQTPWQLPESFSSYHLYPIKLNLHEIKLTQREVYAGLHAAGILANLHYIPVYRQPYYESLGFKQGLCPEAEKYFKETISLPMYPGLTANQQGTVVNALRKILTE